MKNQFRRELFDMIQKTIAALPGTQKQKADALGLNQNDVSMVKRNQIESFSADKLIDIAAKCGWSFSFQVIDGDKAIIKSAVTHSRNVLKAQLDGMNIDWSN